MGEEICSEEFIREARLIQEDIRKNKVSKLYPLKVKRIWEADA